MFTNSFWAVQRELILEQFGRTTAKTNERTETVIDDEKMESISYGIQRARFVYVLKREQMPANMHSHKEFSKVTKEKKNVSE